MKLEYLRIDMMSLINHNVLFDWLHKAPDCEWREDYLSFFVLKGSKTHSWLMLVHGDIFE